MGWVQAPTVGFLYELHRYGVSVATVQIEPVVVPAGFVSES